MKSVVVAVMLGGVVACGGGGPDRPGIEQVDRVVVIGDNAATGPAHTGALVRLLAGNDDARFPEWAGHDLAARGLPLIDLARGGDSYHSLAADGAAACGCDQACAATRACVDTAGAAPAAVVVTLGENDLLDLVIKLVLDGSLRTDPQPALDAARAGVAAVLASIDASFTPAPMLVVVLPYDPSDGAGDVAAIAHELFPLVDPNQLPPELIQPVIAELVDIIRDEAEAAGAIVVDAHDHFLGHAYHATDGAPWVQHLLDPASRGAHELRRLVWTALTGERVEAAPGALPGPEPETLPEMAGVTWAEGVVGAAITPSFRDAMGVEWVNVATDPAETVGAPNGSEAALGITGAWVAVDLGGPAALGDGPDLIVIERGARALGAPEPYRVLVAASPEGPWTPLADGRGERAFELEGVDGAVRYVRVESNAAIPDITGGFGSPLYPGPEIDAVGAVHPPVR